LNSKRIEEFCEKLIKKHINITWACEARVDSISKELVELMSAAGCNGFYFGVESGSQRILDMINKQITVEQIENAINWCKRYGVRPYCSLITGLPGETYEDYVLTKTLMAKLKPYAHVFNVFVAIPDSSLYKHILNNKLYEYIDDIGLLYPPGYDIKTKYFYGRDSECFVDYPFKQRTVLDNKLMKELNRPKCLKGLTTLTDSVFNDVILKIRKMRANS
jgi:radical SAM superfamily enzyme YgiQ (UPF0313 family)